MANATMGGALCVVRYAWSGLDFERWPSEGIVGQRALQLALQVVSDKTA